MKYSIVNFIFLSFFFNTISASEIDLAIANKLYNPTAKSANIDKDILFWESRVVDKSKSKIALQKLSGLFSDKYKIEGNITDLNNAIDYLSASLELPTLNRAPALRKMARLKIMKHQFCEALDLAIMAEEIGSEKRQTYLLMFDIYNEIGEEIEAMSYLEQVKSRKDFEYYIRLSKWSDGAGDLQNAIHYIKVAKDFLAPNDYGRLNWVYSNLGDYYGHDKNIEASYESYKKALQYDKSDWYSMKGLAWISYSYFGDNEKALEILENVKMYNTNVALDYLKFQILSTGSQKNQESLKSVLIKELNKPQYDKMYSDVLVDLYKTDKRYYGELINLANNEIDERPTAESYTMLALALIKNNDYKSAMKIYQDKIKGQTFEPKVFLRLYDLTSQYSTLKSEFDTVLQDAVYELGPYKMCAIAI